MDLVCHSCDGLRRKQGQNPRKLQIVVGRSELKKLVVGLCPFCDGNAYQLATRKDRGLFDINNFEPGELPEDGNPLD